MAVLRPHLALTVSDVERSIPFYAALFGTDPEKVKPGYAKFEVADIADRIAVLRRGRNVGVRQRAETTPDEIVKMIVGIDTAAA